MQTRHNTFRINAPIISMLSNAHSNHLEMESFARIVMRKNSITVENLQFFDDFRKRASEEVK